MRAPVFARHVVVDGSNIATEGRSLPSLAQLDEAVREYRREFPDDTIVVVVDATFGHRIDESERPTFDEAVAHNEIVSPPAGAIGRGDAFLLRIAEKVGATVLSNDSFQEFHGEYEWLFTNGRLIGGKPVPGVGWIFTPRTPVRGPKSRDAVRTAKRERVRRPRPEEERIKVQKAIAVATEEVVEPDSPSVKRRRRRRGSAPPAEPVNEPLAFIELVAKYPLGSEIDGEVENFSSHGAFVQAGGARCYIPLGALGDPPPRAAKDVLRKGETRTFVVQALDPPRRGVELALPEFARVSGSPSPETVEEEIRTGEAGSPDGARPRRRGRGGRRRSEIPAESTDVAADATAFEADRVTEPPAVVAAEPAPVDERAPARAARTRAAAKAGGSPAKARTVEKSTTAATEAGTAGQAWPGRATKMKAAAPRRGVPAETALATTATAAPARNKAPAKASAVPVTPAVSAKGASARKAPTAKKAPAARKAPTAKKAPAAKKVTTKKALAAKEVAVKKAPAAKALAAKEVAVKKAPAVKGTIAKVVPVSGKPVTNKARATTKAAATKAPAVKKAPAKKAPAAKKATTAKRPTKVTRAQSE